MNKIFNLYDLLTIVGGRLTSGDGLFLVLKHVTNDNSVGWYWDKALDYLRLKNPKWLQEANDKFNEIKELCPIKTDNVEQFRWITNYIKEGNNPVFQINQLKDEFDTTDYKNFISKKNKTQ